METCYVESKGKEEIVWTKAETENYTFIIAVFCGVSPMQALQPKDSKTEHVVIGKFKKRLAIS